jgi:hypothetical protein
LGQRRPPSLTERHFTDADESDQKREDEGNAIPDDQAALAARPGHHDPARQLRSRIQGKQPLGTRLPL